jgi:hypothetical protein
MEDQRNHLEDFFDELDDGSWSEPMQTSAE